MFARLPNTHELNTINSFVYKKKDFDLKNKKSFPKKIYSNSNSQRTSSYTVSIFVKSEMYVIFIIILWFIPFYTLEQ